MNPPKKYNTRIAPSPTGFIHLGNIRTAYHNYLAAKASGGQFILRIDDTDKERSKEEYVTKIHETFQWLGLDYSYTFRQSSQLKLYQEISQVLITRGMAEVIEGGAIRLKNMPYIPSFWIDKIAGKIEVSAKDIEVLQNIIIMRSDGMPTYNFASIVDDLYAHVNLIIRGTDHISNTIKQLCILYCLADTTEYDFARTYLEDLEFAHTGLVFEKGAKLSKRSNNSNLDFYKENGYHPDAILNWILRLGWSPSDAEFDKKNTVITKDKAIELFLTEGSLRNASSSLDINKLIYYNKKHKHLNKPVAVTE